MRPSVLAGAVLALRVASTRPDSWTDEYGRIFDLFEGDDREVSEALRLLSGTGRQRAHRAFAEHGTSVA